MSLCSCAIVEKTTKHTTVQGINGSYGLIGGPDLKTFETKGLVFVTIAMEDSFPNTSDYDKSIVADELLKKAHAIGADDIVNIRVYRKDVRIKEPNDNNIFTRNVDPREYEKHTYEYHASALAIKYNGTVFHDSEGPWVATDSGNVIGREMKIIMDESDIIKLQPVKNSGQNIEATVSAPAAAIKARRVQRKAAQAE